MRQYSYMHSSMQTHATEGPANGLSANTRLHREQKAHALLRDQLIVSCAVALGCARLFEALRLRWSREPHRRPRQTWERPLFPRAIGSRHHPSVRRTRHSL